jgi:hypothetical protein
METSCRSTRPADSQNPSPDAKTLCSVKLGLTLGGIWHIQCHSLNSTAVRGFERWHPPQMVWEQLANGVEELKVETHHAMPNRVQQRLTESNFHSLWVVFGTISAIPSIPTLSTVSNILSPPKMVWEQVVTGVKELKAETRPMKLNHQTQSNLDSLGVAFGRFNATS